MWCRRRESNDTRLLILRNSLQTYERQNRTNLCMPASYVQNHVQQFEGRVRRGPLNAGLRSSFAELFVTKRSPFGAMRITRACARPDATSSTENPSGT